LHGRNASSRFLCVNSQPSTAPSRRISVRCSSLACCVDIDAYLFPRLVMLSRTLRLPRLPTSWCSRQLVAVSSHLSFFSTCALCAQRSMADGRIAFQTFSGAFVLSSYFSCSNVVMPMNKTIILFNGYNLAQTHARAGETDEKEGERVQHASTDGVQAHPDRRMPI
jgi:hypothetical protein